MPRAQSLTSMLVVACAVAGFAGCGGDSGTSPDAVPVQVFQGTLGIPASSVAVVAIQVDQPGTLRGVVDWNSVFNDLDIAFVRGTCTAAQIVLGTTPGCPTHAALAQGTAVALGFDDDQFRKPSTFATPVTPGAHTLVVWNFAFFDETFFLDSRSSDRVHERSRGSRRQHST